MVLMSVSILSTHLHNAYWDIWSVEDGSSPWRFLRSFACIHFVFMSLGVVMTWTARSVSLCELKHHHCIHATVNPLLPIVINIITKWSVFASVLISEINTLHECTVPPIGELLASQTTAHYFRFTLYLCSAYKCDSPLWDLRILEQVHGCFWHHELQFSSNNITFIKSSPSAVCMRVNLKCKFHLLLYFLPIYSVNSFRLEFKFELKTKINL